MQCGRALPLRKGPFSREEVWASALAFCNVARNDARPLPADCDVLGGGEPVSDNDSFMNEVSEEVRKDRMFSLWRRYGGFVIGGVVAIVIAAGAKTWMDHQAEQAAQSAGGALIAAADGPPEAAAEALTALAAETDHDGAAVLAKLRAAAAFAEAGDKDAAVTIYDALAADASADRALQDFAGFRSVILRADDMGADDLIGALAPIANGTGPYRLLAMEAQGLAQLKSGNRDAAVEAFQSIMLDEQAPQGLRQRVEAVLTTLNVSTDLNADG